MKREKLKSVPFTPILDLICDLAFKEQDQETFLGGPKSEALFNICFSSLVVDPTRLDALEAFSEIFRSYRVDPAVKEQALATLAMIANNTGIELQQQALATIRGLDKYLNDNGDMWRATGFNGRLGYAVSVMSDERPINGYINGQLTTVVDFDCVVASRREAILATQNS